MKDLQVPVHLPSIISQLPPREPHGPCKEKICPEKDDFCDHLRVLETILIMNKSGQI